MIRLVRSASTYSKHPKFVISNSDEAEVFKRISAAYNILSNTSKKFRYSVVECSDLYKSKDVSLLSDIFKYPRINKALFDLLCKNYLVSNSIRSLMLDDMKDLWENKQYNLLREVLSHICERGEITGFQLKKRNRELSAECDLWNQFAVFTALSGEPLVACRFIVVPRSNLSIEDQTIEIILKCLTNYRGQQHQYYCFAILRLILTYPLYSYSANQISSIISFSLSSNDDCYFSNLIFEKLKSHIPESQENEALNKSLKDLIYKNLTQGQYSRALCIWLDLSFLDGVFNDSKIHSAFFSNLPRHEKREFIRLYGLQNFNDDVLESLIEFHGEHGQLRALTDIVTKIKAPVRKLTLSVLLEAFLSQGKDKESEQILLSILKSKEGLCHDNFNSIIKSLLKGGKVTKAFSMTTETDVNLSKSAYFSLFSHILTENDSANHRKFILSMVDKFKSIEDNHICGNIFPTIILYLTKHYNIQTSRSVFVEINKNLDQFKIWDDKTVLLDLEKFNIPNDVYEIMTLTKSNIISSLFTIMEGASKAANIEIIKWCILELRQNGTLLKDILTFIRATDEQLFHRYFNEDIENFIN